MCGLRRIIGDGRQGAVEKDDEGCDRWMPAQRFSICDATCDKMKISDLLQKDIRIGIRVRSLRDPELLGTIVQIIPSDDYLTIIEWDKDEKYSGFYGNDCECEVVEC